MTQNSTALARTEPTALATHQGWSDEDLNWLCEANPTLKNCSKGQQALFGAFCKHAGLNPMLRLVHPISVKGAMQIQIGVDGWQTMAERTGKYGGVVIGPLFCGEDGVWKEIWLARDAKTNRPIPPVACKVGVRRLDYPDPVCQVIYYAEFYTDSNPNWKDKPLKMLEVRAICHAIRKAFPDLAQTISSGFRAQEGGRAAVSLVYGGDLETGELVAEDVADAEFEEREPEVTASQVAAAAKKLWGKETYGEQLKAKLAEWNAQAREMKVDLIATEVETPDGPRASVQASTPAQLQAILWRIEHLAAEKAEQGAE